MSVLETYQKPLIQNPLRKKDVHPLATMNHVAAVILGGGQGSRLFPLTKKQCKPALHFGGRYRLVDIPISNAIHNNIRRIYVLTQFLSTTLHQHIFQAYHPGVFSELSIEMLTAEQRHDSSSWFQGTADAVRKNLHYLLESSAEYFLILSADQLYQMDFQKMLQMAIETDADLTIAAHSVNGTDAKRMGLLRINAKNQVIDFAEKPQQKAVLQRFATKSLQRETNSYLASMGIYLFRRKALISLLKEESGHDFGRDLIPSMINKKNVTCFNHQGHWEDIGTVESFYKANIALTKPSPSFSLHCDIQPTFCKSCTLPPPKINDTMVKHSIISEGCNICAASISNSVVGPAISIDSGTKIYDSYLMGQATVSKNQLSIGKDCTLKEVIFEKNVRVGNRVKLVNSKKLQTYENNGIFIRDGIIIVSEGVLIPDDFSL